MLLLNLPHPPPLYKTWFPNYSTTSPLRIEPLFPPIPTYLYNNPFPYLSYSWLLFLSLSDLNEDSDQGLLIRSTGDIFHMTILQFSALHNGYLTTLILWYNLCISPNNKQNSKMVIFVKTLYVTFICTPHNNAVSESQGYRHIGVE